MNRMTRILLTAVIAATAATSSPSPSLAQKAALATPAPVQAADASGPAADSWWGAGAAIACGFGLRYGGALGGWGIAGTAVVCLIAFVDAIS